jgi:hypothetical protein
MLGDLVLVAVGGRVPSMFLQRLCDQRGLVHRRSVCRAKVEALTF